MSNFKFNRYEDSSNPFLIAAVITTFAVVVLLLLGVYGYRFNLFTVGYSLLTLTKYSIYVSILSFSLALISLGYTFKIYKKFLSILLSIFILLFNITIIIFFYVQILDLRSNPLINDISTDYSDLIKFKIHTEHNSPEDEHSLLQKFGGFKKPNYSLAPLVLKDVDKAQVFDKSLIIIQNMGLNISYKNMEEGIIEAVEESFWYKFKDDMIIKIEELISGNVMINVRSASRTGKSDLGKNTKRIKSYFAFIKKEMISINK